MYGISKSYPYCLAIAAICLFGRAPLVKNNSLAQADAASLNQSMATPQQQADIDNIAEALLDPRGVILLGQIRSDGMLRDEEGPKSVEAQLDTALLSLSLQRVFVKEVLRGPERVPRVIYVQRQPPAKNIRYRGDLIGDDTLRVFLLKQATELTDSPLTIPADGKALSESIAKKVGNTPPEQLFKEIGIGEWLNPSSWFELYGESGGIRIDGSVAERPLNKNLSEGRKAAIEEMRMRVRTAMSKNEIYAWSLPTLFAEDLRTLIRTLQEAGEAKSRGDSVTHFNCKTEEGNAVARVIDLRRAR